MHHDGGAARGERDGGGQAGEAGADNMDGASHYKHTPDVIRGGHRFLGKIMLKELAKAK